MCRSIYKDQMLLESNNQTNDTLHTFSFDPENTSSLSDHLDSVESKLLGTVNTSEVKLIHLCDHKNHENRSFWEPCLITGGQLSDIESLLNIESTPKIHHSTPFRLPNNKFNPIDMNNLHIQKSDLLEHSNENVTKSNGTPTNLSESSRVFHTSRFDNWIEDTTTPLPTTPGSISSTQAWLFPDEGNKKQPRGFIIDHTSSVYFDPSLRKGFNKVYLHLATFI